MQAKALYKAIMYLRLSREDEEKDLESNSIKNQRQLILDFLKKHPEIKLICEKVDDGYTGVDFNRPGFQEMMEEIRCGRCDCVVVKDLSRFARNFIESGKYIQQIFPLLGVRFIAINDNYDSADSDFQTDHLYIPLKNLINDTYSRDISIKMRSHCEFRMNKGYLVAAFPVYGYFKSEDRKSLVVDEYAAGVVQTIFSCKLMGMSLQGIADMLNEKQILCPSEYKKSLGMNYSSGLRKSKTPKWYLATVKTILTNPVYIGTLVQGKRYRPNYKIKKMVDRAEEGWYITENAHEAIVSKEDFDTVQRLLMLDVRVAPNKDATHMLSGFLFCGDCHQLMSRRYVQAKRKKYYYYNCSSNRRDKSSCTPHNTKEEKIVDAILAALNRQFEVALNIEQMLDYIAKLPADQRKSEQLDAHLGKLKQELERNQRYKRLTFEKFNDGIINEAMFQEYTDIYSRKCEELEAAIAKRKEEVDALLSGSKETKKWINIFKNHRNVKKLDRMLLIKLIDHVDIYDDSRINIVFRYQDQFNTALSIIENYRKESA